MLLMPMFFTSGALFPLSRLPGWLHLVTRLNPLTYAVDPLRHAVFAHLHADARVRAVLDPGITWWGWRVPTAVELAVVAVVGLAMLGVAVLEFRRAE